MKVRTKILKMCEHCFTVRKKGKAYVYCKADPRHKQRQKFSFLSSTIDSNLATTSLAMRFMGGEYEAMKQFLLSESTRLNDN